MYILSVGVCYLHVCLYTLSMKFWWRPGEAVRSSGTGLPDRCEAPGRCWELNLDLLQEQPALFTSELSLQTLLNMVFYFCAYIAQRI